MKKTPNHRNCVQTNLLSAHSSSLLISRGASSEMFLNTVEEVHMYGLLLAVFLHYQAQPIIYLFVCLQE